ncbi:MAG TPA: alpha/beta hydrolase-fold protein [Edaphobacter sp.]|nr:alpha/beta hydrolase-fold protein [Edaphobacter sp.]
MKTRSCQFVLAASLAIGGVSPAASQSTASQNTASKPAAPCTSTVVGALQTRTLTSTTFGDPQTLRIWLPPGYNDPANAQKRYPVLYMFDGENLFDACTSSLHREWRIDESLTRLIAANLIEPLIVVGIDSPGKRRADEYIPYADPFFSAPEPHGRLLPEFLATEVLPLINRELHTIPDPDHTAIGGSSYGSIAALYALLHRPDLFHLALLESTSLQVGNGQLLRDTLSLVVGPRRVSVGVGTNELGNFQQFARDRAIEPDAFNAGFVQLSEQLVTNLKAAMNHPTVVFIKQPGAMHDENAWAERFPDAIKFLFPKTSK